MPRGTPVEETGRVAEMLEREALATVGEYDASGREGLDPAQRVRVVGATLAERRAGGRGASSGSHLADVALYLEESETRGIPSERDREPVARSGWGRSPARSR